MATLSPILNAGIGYEQPVEQPSFLAAASNVIGNFLQAKSSSGGSDGATDRRQEIEDAGYQWVASEYARAADARAQGYTKEADLIMRQANVQASIHYGINTGGERFRSFQESYTGMPSEVVGLNAEEIAFNELRATPEFTMFVSAAPAEYDTPEKKEQYALGAMQRLNAAKAEMELGAANFTMNTQRAYLTTLDTQLELLKGIASRPDGGLNTGTLEDVQLFRKEWDTTVRTQFVRPAGVSEELWKPVQDRLDSVDRALTALEFYEGSGAAKELNEAASAKARGAIAEVFLNSGTIGDAILADGILGGNAGVLGDLMNRVVLRGDNLDHLIPLFDKKITSADITDPTSTTIFPEQVTSEISALPTEDKLVIAQTAASITNDPRTAELFGSSPKATDDYVNMMTKGLAALSSLGTDEQGSWLSKGGYQSIFSPTFYSNLTALETIDPAAAAEIKMMAVNAIDNQAATLTLNLQSRTEGGLFVFDRATGKFAVNPDAETFINRRYGERTGKRVLDTVELYYNGDYEALLKDKGARLFKASMPRQGAAYAGITYLYYRGDRGQKEEDARVAYEAMQGYFSEKPPEASVKLGESLQFLDTQKKALMGSIEGQVQQQLPGDERGSSLSDKLTNIQFTRGELPAEAPSGVPAERANYNEGALGLVQLIDRTEGGANYDTLFGFSNNKGPFAGTQVSNMTLAEAIQFSDPKGAYGQWVKGEVGRVATPMGRYQIVGSTLKAAVEEMGLDPNLPFSPQIQDAIFTHLAAKRLSSATTQEEKRAGLRAEWEGFKNVSDEELDMAIAAFESGVPMDFGGISITSNPAAATSASARPAARPESLRVGGSESATQGASSGGGVAPMASGEGASSARSAAPSGGSAAQEGSKASAKATELTDANLSDRSRRVLARAQKTVGDVVAYRSIGEAIKDQQAGKLGEDALISINGEVFQL